MNGQEKRLPRPLRSCRRPVGWLVAAFLLVLGLAGQADAYVDPNTGGYIFQILFPIVSAIVAAFLFFKSQIVNLWKKIGGRFKKGEDS